MGKEYSAEFRKKVENYLEEEGLSFYWDEEDEVIKTEVRLPEVFYSVSYVIDIREKEFFVYAYCPVRAKLEDSIVNNMTKFICAANYGLKYGNFEFDSRDGEIRYKCYMIFKDMQISDVAVHSNIYCPGYMIYNYGPGILLVNAGRSAEEAITVCRGESAIKQELPADTEPEAADDEENEEDVVDDLNDWLRQVEEEKPEDAEPGDE